MNQQLKWLSITVVGTYSFIIENLYNNHKF